MQLVCLSHLLHHGVQGDGGEVKLLQHHGEDLTVPKKKQGPDYFTQCINPKLKRHLESLIKAAHRGHILLARVGEDDDGPVVVLVSERLDQVHQVGVLHLLWGEDVSLVQLLHRPSPVNDSQRIF